MRLKMIQDYEQYRKGDVIRVSQAKGKLLLKAGAAVITRDVTAVDLRNK